MLQEARRWNACLQTSSAGRIGGACGDQCVLISRGWQSGHCRGIQRMIRNGCHFNVPRYDSIIVGRRCPCWRRRRRDDATMYIIKECIVADDAFAFVTALGVHICFGRRQVYCLYNEGLSLIISNCCNLQWDPQCYLVMDTTSTIQQCGGAVLFVPCLLDVPPVGDGGGGDRCRQDVRGGG